MKKNEQGKESGKENLKGYFGWGGLERWGPFCSYYTVYTSTFFIIGKMDPIFPNHP